MNSRDCRARVDCTYVHADLGLHCPQDKSMVEQGRIRFKPGSASLRLNSLLQKARENDSYQGKG